jgi:hypothetical protein
VEIQNLGPRIETIQGLTMLGQLVQLEVQSLGSCGVPIPILTQGKPQPAVPITLGPKRRISVVFDVNFACANDGLSGRGHEDFRYRATLNPAALESSGDVPLPPQTSPLSALTDVIVRVKAMKMPEGWESCFLAAVKFDLIFY